MSHARLSCNGKILASEDSEPVALRSHDRTLCAQNKDP
jgi:hypothetical protein